jgi:hypothetical protein
MVVKGEISLSAFACLNDWDEYMKKNCATLIRGIVEHISEWAEMIVNAVDYMFDQGVKVFVYLE